MATGESKEADYGDVLLAIVQRLRDTVNGCAEGTCYLSLDPDELPGSPGSHLFVVAPLSGQFRNGAFIGGALGQLTVEGGVVVKIHAPSLSDQAHRDVVALTSESVGLIRKATAVIAALCANGQAGLSVDHWVPTKAGVELTEPLAPLNFSLGKDAKGVVRSIELTFSCNFDWDVTKQSDFKAPE